jgi:lipopolysaccharide export system permease protein
VLYHRLSFDQSYIIYIPQITMLQNKIYLNFIIEIFKTFLLILFGFSLIALTVRAVSFLDLIVDNGYPVITYFQYSGLNLMGIAPKFIPLSFLIALTIFILKHEQEGELVILWTSGVKKMKIVNLFFIISFSVLIFYLIFSTFLTPFALNKSRQLLSNDKLNSFLPTIKNQSFSDSFKGFTFIVEQKRGNEIKNIFLNDKGNNLKNLSSNSSGTKSTTIIAESGMINQKEIFLINGQIITSKENDKNEIIKFEQLNIDLDNLSTTTIKKPKIQELSTLKLLACFKKNLPKNLKLCNDNFKKEIFPVLNRRLVLPFYIPVISLICSFLLIKTEKRYFNKISIFIYSFTLLLFTELAVRYTGINLLTRFSFVVFPVILLLTIYSFLFYQFSKENKFK